MSKVDAYAADVVSYSYDSYSSPVIFGGLLSRDDRLRASQSPDFTME